MSPRGKISVAIFLLLALNVAVFGGGLIADNLEEPPAAVSGSTTSTPNKYAIMAGSGDPLPTNAHEDVIIGLDYVDSADPTSSISVEIDYPNDWRATVAAQEQTLVIAFIDGDYYGQDPNNGLWANITKEQADKIFQLDGYMITDEQLSEFHSVLVLLEPEPCATVLCAVWEAEDVELGELINISVNKITRKIHSVSGLNDLGLFVMSYQYREVVLSPPNIPVVAEE